MYIIIALVIAIAALVIGLLGGNQKKLEQILPLFLRGLLETAIVLLVSLITLVKKTIVDPIYCVLRFRENTYITDTNINKFYDGKVVLVTGASSGIGECVARKLVSSCNLSALIISGRGQSKLDEVIASCKSIKPNTKYASWGVDLQDYRSIEGSYKALSKELEALSIGPIDVLINVAGISSRGGALEATLESLEKVMNTNFYGTVEITRHVANDMVKAKKGGSIAVITSIQGKVALPLRTSYSSSKHAVQAYFEGLRGELLPYKIDTTIIAPGYVSTQLSMNAVNSDGSTYGKMDENTAKGMKPDYVALEILKGIANKELDVVIADGLAITAITAKNLVPELLAKMTQNRK